jgi:spore germination protein Q
MPGQTPGAMGGALSGAVMPPPPAQGSQIPGSGGTGSQMPTPPGMLPMEQSFIENILRLNLGKTATIYMTFENNSEWNAKVFRGVLEAAGRDHIIISDPQTGTRYLLLMVNLDYITFDEPLQYTYPY